MDHERGNCVKATLDGGFITVGGKQSAAGFPCYAWLMKTDESGDTIWTNAFNFQYITNGLAVLPLADSNYVIVGNTQPNYSNDASLIIFKVSNLGQLIWVKYYGGSGYDIAYDVKLKTNGGFIITGQYDQRNIWLLNTDSNGDTIWTKLLGEPSYNNQGHSVDLAADGGFIIAGTIAEGNLHPAAIKTDSLGNMLWQKIITNTYEGYLNSIKQLSDGGFIAAGYSYTPTQNVDVFIVKFNNNGDTVWTRLYGGSGSDYAQDIIELPNKNLIIVGYTSSFEVVQDAVYILWVSQTGILLNSKVYDLGQDDEALSIDCVNNESFIISGVSGALGSDDLLLMYCTVPLTCTPYVMGDINGDFICNGADVVYGVRYFKGLGPQPQDSCYHCTDYWPRDDNCYWLYVAADANGNCEFRGSDISRLVSYFKGTAYLHYCSPSFPPLP